MKWIKYILPNGITEKSILYTENTLEIAKAEAYNGEYTIEDDGLPEPEVKQTPEERIAELEAALALLLNKQEVI